MKRNIKSKELIPFEQTLEGQNYEMFEKKWNDSLFGKEAGSIDTKKLWWSLLSWSEQGNMYKNWMAAARTFYLKSPNQYTIYHGTKATQGAIDFDRTNQQVSASRGEDYFIPEHLRNNGSGN